MLELFYAPFSRASRIYALLVAMDVLDQVKVTPVSVRRHDGSGGADPANPHPEGKVPVLMVDGLAMRESPAILLYLTDRFRSPLGPGVDASGRAAYLTWLAYYGGVVEPVLTAMIGGVADNPAIQLSFRGKPELDAMLTSALADKPWLLGDNYSAADLLIASTYAWMPEYAPPDAKVQDWIARCLAQPWVAAAMDYDKSLMAQ